MEIKEHRLLQALSISSSPLVLMEVHSDADLKLVMHFGQHLSSTPNSSSNAFISVLVLLFDCANASKGASRLQVYWRFKLRCAMLNTPLQIHYSQRKH